MRTWYELILVLLFIISALVWVVFACQFKKRAQDNPKWFRQNMPKPRYWLAHFSAVLIVVVVLISAYVFPVEALFFRYNSFEEAVASTMGHADYTLKGETFAVAIKSERSAIYRYSYQQRNGQWYRNDRIIQKHTVTEIAGCRVFTFAARGCNEAIVLVVNNNPDCCQLCISDELQSTFVADTSSAAQHPFQMNGQVSYAIVEVPANYYKLTVGDTNATIKIR